MAIEDIKAQFGLDIVNNIIVEAEEMGLELSDDLESVAEYAAQRADILSLAIGEPGFEFALKAERDNIALRSAHIGVERADDIDAKILAATRGGLVLAARALRIITGLPAV